MNNTATSTIRGPIHSRPNAIPAAYLTHELRAPVTAIRLGLEILQEQLKERLQSDETHMLAVTLGNTARLERLVNDILDYSKIIAGKMSLQKGPCDARKLISDAVDSLRATAISKGVKLIKEGGEPLPRIGAESRRIGQILTNLISNAIKFTPSRGSVTVSVGLGKYEHEGTLLFKVKDTGRGIDPKDVHKIFDMFEQSSANMVQTEGTGLGLALSRLMVELHGGKIWAENWRGLGATFCFTIPIDREDLGRKIEPYPQPVQYSGLILSMTRNINALLALFV